MAQVTSNLGEIARVLDGLSHLLDLDRKAGGHRRLGDEAADVIAAGIVQRTLAEQLGPGGAPLEANRGDYGKAKRARGVPVGVGLRGSEVGGDMLEFDQVRGQVAVGRDAMAMQYGLDEAMKDEAAWFSEGNPANNQPPRPFYLLDETIIARLDELFDEAAERGIRDLGGGR